MKKSTRIISVSRYFLISLCLPAIIMLASCSKLGMENDAPSAPILISDGVYYPVGVEVLVTVDDANGDMVALHFTATNDGSILDFTWSSFIASGEEGSFFLGLVPGTWTLTAQARDELEDLSPITSYELIVSQPR